MGTGNTFGYVGVRDDSSTVDIDRITKFVFPDGSLIPTEADEVQVDFSAMSTVFNVRDFGAVGNGTTDDTAAMIDAFVEALAVRGRLYIPFGRYLLTGSGTEIFLINKSIEIFGDGMTASTLVIDSAVPNTRDVIRIKPPTWALPTRTNGEPSTYGWPGGEDNMGYHFHDFGIEAENAAAAEDSNALTVLPGRDAIRIDTSGTREYIHDSTFERLRLHALTGRSIYMHNESGGTHANTDGIFRLTFSECWIHDGIYGAFAGDSLVIDNNTFRGYEKAFESNFVSGVGNLHFTRNNVTSNGGVHIKNGANMNISSNFIEIYKADRDGSTAPGSGGATLELGTSTTQVDTAVLQGNILGSLNANTLDGVLLTNINAVKLDHIYFNIPTGNYFVKETVNALAVVYGFLRGVGGGTLTNNLSPSSFFTIYGQETAPAAPQPGYLSVEHLLSNDVRLGSAPSAAAGNYNVSNAAGLVGRNAANDDNIEIAGVGSDDKVYLGNNGDGIVLRPSAGIVEAQRGFAINGGGTAGQFPTAGAGFEGTFETDAGIVSGAYSGSGQSGAFISQVYDRGASQFRDWFFTALGFLFDSVNGLIIGSGGTGIKLVKGYTPSLTPAAVGTNTTAEQTFTVTGLTTADKVIVNGPAHPAGLALCNVRVTAADTIGLTFMNTSAGSLTPTSGTYNVIAIRT